MNITAQQIITKIRGISEKHSDRFCSMPRYNGPVNEICLFGEAFRQLGIQIPSRLNGSHISVVLKKFNINTTQIEMDWMCFVQKGQDNWKKWGLLVIEADKKYPECKVRNISEEIFYDNGPFDLKEVSELANKVF